MPVFFPKTFFYVVFVQHTQNVFNTLTQGKFGQYTPDQLAAKAALLFKNLLQRAFDSNQNVNQKLYFCEPQGKSTDEAGEEHEEPGRLL